MATLAIQNCWFESCTRYYTISQIATMAPNDHEPWLDWLAISSRSGQVAVPQIVIVGRSVWFGLNHYSFFYGSEGHVALDRNPGPGYDTLLLRMIPGDLLSAFPHRQFHTLPSLLDSWAALSISYPNALRAKQGGRLYHFYDGL